jgi:hypothetical protein
MSRREVRGNVQGEHSETTDRNRHGPERPSERDEHSVRHEADRERQSKVSDGVRDSAALRSRPCAARRPSLPRVVPHFRPLSVPP